MSKSLKLTVFFALSVFLVFSSYEVKAACNTFCQSICKASTGVTAADEVLWGESCADICGSTSGACFDSCGVSQAKEAVYDQCVFDASIANACAIVASDYSTCRSSCGAFGFACIDACYTSSVSSCFIAYVDPCVGTVSGHDGCKAACMDEVLSDPVTRPACLNDCESVYSYCVDDDCVFDAELDLTSQGFVIDYFTCNSGCYYEVHDIGASTTSTYEGCYSDLEDIPDDYDGVYDDSDDALAEDEVDDTVDDVLTDAEATTSDEQCGVTGLNVLSTAVDYLYDINFDTVKFSVDEKFTWKGVKFKCEYYDVAGKIQEIIDIICSMAEIVEAATGISADPDFSSLSSSATNLLSAVIDVDNLVKNSLMGSAMTSISGGGDASDVDPFATFNSSMITALIDLQGLVEDIQDSFEFEPYKTKWHSGTCHL